MVTVFLSVWSARLACVKLVQSSRIKWIIGSISLVAAKTNKESNSNFKMGLLFAKLWSLFGTEGKRMIHFFFFLVIFIVSIASLEKNMVGHARMWAIQIHRLSAAPTHWFGLCDLDVCVICILVFYLQAAGQWWFCPSIYYLVYTSAQVTRACSLSNLCSQVANNNNNNNIDLVKKWIWSVPYKNPFFCDDDHFRKHYARGSSYESRRE